MKKHILSDTISEKLKHKDFGFRCLLYSVSKSVGTFDVMIHNKRNVACGVKVMTHDDTATAGVDHQAINEILAFAAGQTFKSVSVRIMETDGHRPDSHLAMQLYDATNGIPLVGKDTQTKITIVDEGEAPQ